MKIVAIHTEPGAVGWYRCWNWTSAMKRLGHSVKHRPHEGAQIDWNKLDDYLHGVDVVIVGRTVHAKLFAALLAGRDLYHYKLVVDTDDNSDDIPHFNQSHPDYHAGTGAARLIRAQLRAADMVTVSTENLATWARQYSGHVVVMPNVVDHRIYGSVKTRQKEARHAGDFRIYWGGGGGHYGDLLLVREPLLKVFHERPNVKLVFSNFIPDWAARLPMFRSFMIRFAHFNAYPKVLRWLCADTAIAPLVDNTFNSCKSHVKWLDYGMAGIPGIYQDLAPYDSVMDGITGLKARTQDDWYVALNRMIDEPSLRANIAQNSTREILQSWNIDHHIYRYETTLKELVARERVPEFQYLEEGVSVNG